MILVSVMYPAGPKFDLRYDLGHHRPLVRERWSPMGLHEAKVVTAPARRTAAVPRSR